MEQSNINVISFNKDFAKRGSNMKDITKERKIEIEKTVQKVLGDYDFEKLPAVDISTIVKQYGFKVKTAELPIETTGYLYVDDTASSGENKIIIVNKTFANPDNESDVVFKKSRFITAHELGHYLLHKKDKEIYAHRDINRREDEVELEADYFARSILMPLAVFRRYVQVCTELSGDENFTAEILSKVFHVTKNKVKKRMEDISQLA